MSKVYILHRECYDDDPGNDIMGVYSSSEIMIDRNQDMDFEFPTEEDKRKYPEFAGMAHYKKKFQRRTDGHARFRITICEVDA